MVAEENRNRKIGKEAGGAPGEAGPREGEGGGKGGREEYNGDLKKRGPSAFCFCCEK